MTWITSHASDSQHRRYLLLQWLLGGTTYRWTTADVPVVTSGSTGAAAGTWSPKAFAVDGISAGQASEGAQATITFGVADGVISATILATVAEGSPLKVWESWLDPAASTVISQQERCLLDAKVDSYAIRRTVCKIETSPAAPLAGITIPRRTYTPGGSALFKGTLCGYAGVETECNLSLARCTVLGNQARFCGFPYVLGGV